MAVAKSAGHRLPLGETVGFDLDFVALNPVDTVGFDQKRETSYRLDIRNSDQHLAGSSHLEWDIADFDSRVETIGFDLYPVALTQEGTVGVDPFRVEGMAEDFAPADLVMSLQ